MKDSEDTKRLKRLMKALDDAVETYRRLADGLKSGPKSSPQDNTPTSPPPDTLPDNHESS